MLSLKNNKKGFTIIEVLIVLAIAGVIMLVVFLAVPALQRNSRNTQRRSDVARIGGAVTEFTQNNNGTLPVAANTAAVYASAGTLSQYVVANLSVTTGAQTALTDITLMEIVTGAKCSTAGATVGPPTASSRQVALQYMVETSGAATAVCQDM